MGEAGVAVFCGRYTHTITQVPLSHSEGSIIYSSNKHRK